MRTLPVKIRAQPDIVRYCSLQQDASGDEASGTSLAEPQWLGNGESALEHVFSRFPLCPCPRSAKYGLDSFLRLLIFVDFYKYLGR